MIEIEKLSSPRVGVRMTLSVPNCGGKAWHRTVELTDGGDWQAGLAGVDGVKFAEFADAARYAERDLQAEADDWLEASQVRWRGRRAVDAWLIARRKNDKGV